jgi:5-formyltetrahydrofolate cyclo-ligase
MYKKEIIRKKNILIRKKKYFQVSLNFFLPLLKLLKKKFKNNNFSLSLYYPSNYEVDVVVLRETFGNKKIKILLPVVKKKSKIRFEEWKNFDPLKVNKFGILEPYQKAKPIIPDVILVPLLAFDAKNNRLGYGKGYYDKFLNDFLRKKNILTIGIAFSFQKYNKLPVTNFDVKLDYILTEKGLSK